MSSLVRKQSTLAGVLSDVARALFPIQVELQHNPNFGQFEFRFQLLEKNMKFLGKGPVVESQLVNSDDPQKEMVEAGTKIGREFVSGLPESVTGKYPLTRLWHDQHLNSTAPLFCNPEVDVPGWVHNRYRGQGPPDGTLSPRTYDAEGSIDESDYTDRLRASVDLVHLQKEREELIDVSRSVKRKVQTRPPRIDVSKIKKPQCPKHDVDMEFSPVKGKWCCTYSSCKMVATPQRADDDRSVQLGKGEVALRVIESDGDTTVLLISDDNIALNITPYIDIEWFLSMAGVLETAKNAQDGGMDEFVEAEPKEIRLKTRVGVIGASDLLEKYGDN